MTEAELADLLETDQTLSALLPEFNDIRKRRAAFELVTGRVADEPADPVVLAQLRADALLSAGLGIDGSVTDRRTEGRQAADPGQMQWAQLDAEFVAIHW